MNKNSLQRYAAVIFYILLCCSSFALEKITCTIAELEDTVQKVISSETLHITITGKFAVDDFDTLRNILSIHENCAFIIDLSTCEFTLAEPVIPNSAFSDCANLQSLVFPKNCAAIGAQAFDGCKTLESVQIPDTVRFIGTEAFAYCEALKEVHLPKSLAYLGTAVFKNCTALIKTVFTGNVLRILPEDTFFYCENLTSLILSDSIEIIHDYALYHAEKITQFVLPASIAVVKQFAFAEDCTLVWPKKRIAVPVGDYGKRLREISKPIALKTEELEDFLYEYEGYGPLYLRFEETLDEEAFEQFSCLSYESTLVYLDLSSCTFATGFSSLPESVFEDVDTLLGVVLPSGLTDIGDYAFYACPSLQELLIPPSVTKIGKAAFGFCQSLVSVVLPPNLQELSAGLFSDMPNLVFVSIPQGVQKIDTFAFENCIQLITIVLPKSLREIGERAFAGCRSLVTVNLPPLLEQLGNTTFKDCTSLKQMIIPVAIRQIPQALLEGCISLNTLTFSGPVEEIGIGAFDNCKSLVFAGIPEGIVSIGARAFAYTILPKDLLIPASVEYVGENAFYRTPVKLLTVAASRAQGEHWDTSWFGDINPHAIRWLDDPVSEFSLTAFLYTASSLDPQTEHQIRIDDTVSVQFLKNLRTALIEYKNLPVFLDLSYAPVLPEVSLLPKRAFAECAGLTGIALPAAVRSLGEYAFDACKKLAVVKTDSPLETIAGTAFKNCAALIALPMGTNTKITGTMELKNCAALVSLELPAGIKEITGDTLSGCRSLTELIIPDSVRKIGKNAFSYCSSLTMLTIPEGVTEIGVDAFAGCLKLERVILPETLRVIGKSAFYRCYSLRSIVLPKNLTTLSDDVFYDCTNLSSIEIPATVTEVGANIFYGCYELASVYIPGLKEKPKTWHKNWNNANRSKVYWGVSAPDTAAHAEPVPSELSVTLSHSWNVGAIYLGSIAVFSLSYTEDALFLPPHTVQLIDWNNNDYVAFEAPLKFIGGKAECTLDSAELEGVTFEMLFENNGSYEFMLCPRLLFSDGTIYDCKDSKLLVLFSQLF